MVSTVWRFVDGVYRAQLKGPLGSSKWRVRPNWVCARRLDGPLQGFPVMENPPLAADEGLLIDLKRGVHAENGFPVLNALDTARRKTLPIAYSVDMEYNGLIHPPRPQKVRMKE